MHESAGREPFTLQPVACSRCSSCFCCCCGPRYGKTRRPQVVLWVFILVVFLRVDAMEYYSGLETDLKEEFDRERKEALSSPLGIAFVTFNSVNMSKTVRCDSKREKKVNIMILLFSGKKYFFMI